MRRGSGLAMFVGGYLGKLQHKKNGPLVWRNYRDGTNETWLTPIGKQMLAAHRDLLVAES